MKRIVSILFVLTSSLLLAACSQSNSKTKTNSHVSKSSQSLRVANNGTPISRRDYQIIKTGNISSPKNGTNQQTILKSFGQPSSKSKVTVNGNSKKAAIQYSWTNLKKGFNASTVTVEFLDNHAIGKGYVEAGLKNRRYLPTTTINKAKTGDSYDHVVNQLGFPDAETLTGNGSLSARNITYATGKNGKAISLMFSGDRLTTKTQTVVK